MDTHNASKARRSRPTSAPIITVTRQQIVGTVDDNGDMIEARSPQEAAAVLAVRAYADNGETDTLAFTHAGLSFTVNIAPEGGAQ